MLCITRSTASSNQDGTRHQPATQLYRHLQIVSTLNTCLYITSIFEYLTYVPHVSITNFGINVCKLRSILHSNIRTNIQYLDCAYKLCYSNFNSVGIGSDQLHWWTRSPSNRVRNLCVVFGESTSRLTTTHIDSVSSALTKSKKSTIKIAYLDMRFKSNTTALLQYAYIHSRQHVLSLPPLRP